MSQIIFSFEAEHWLFVYDLENKIFNHFPWEKANIINVKEEKFDEYKEKWKELQANFRYSFEDLKSLKSTFAYFVKPSTCDIIEDGFPIYEMILKKQFGNWSY